MHPLQTTLFAGVKMSQAMGWPSLTNEFTLKPNSRRIRESTPRRWAELEMFINRFTIGRELRGDLATLQWISTGYTLTLSAFLLLGGSLGDRYGRRRIFLIGVVWFALASALCGIAPSSEALIVARIIQGIGAALLTPGSLAILQASFHPDDRGRAIGAWTGWGGVAMSIGPLLGGYLIDAVSWRAMFLLNLPLAAWVYWLASRHVPETKDPTSGGLDWIGAVLAALGLG